MALLAIFLGLIPGFFWLWVFYRKDKYQPEPKALIALVFFAGVLSVIPTLILEESFNAYVAPLDLATGAVTDWHDLLQIFVVYFFGVGPIEEFCKYLAVRISIYRNRNFNEPVDGVIYAVSAAVGFATLENIFYFIQFSQSFGSLFFTFVMRFFLSSLAHIYFSAMWGYGLGRKKFKLGRAMVIKGLFLAAFLHGLFDFLLTWNMIAAILVLPLMILMGRLTGARIRDLLLLSPYSPIIRAKVLCPSCHKLAQPKDENLICNICGKRIPFSAGMEIHCPRCNTRIDTETVLCPNFECRMHIAPPGLTTAQTAMKLQNMGMLLQPRGKKTVLAQKPPPSTPPADTGTYPPPYQGD
jgi:RsiW-degrading membrane proteinase PrsW (M82 family)